MARYNYYASPYNSPRAMSFREAYDNAPLGQDFMFENQPYARPGPPGLLAEEGAGTATGYRPIEQINPNDRAFMSPEKLALIEANEANRMRLGGRIGGRSKVLRDRPVWDHFEKRWVEPEGSFAQSPHALDALEQDAINDRYASGVTGMYGPGQDTGQPQGLLADDMSGPRWTDFIKLRENSRTPMRDYFQEKDWREHSPEELYERRMAGLIGSPEEQSNTDKSGWMGDQRMRDSQNRKFRLAQMLMNFGNQQSSDDGWDSPLTHD